MPIEDIGEIKFKRMRHCIGVLGLILPFAIVLQANMVGECDCLQDSISHYFYTVSAPSFIGILWGLGLVLIFYPTPPIKDTLILGCEWGICKVFKPKLDGILTTIAGFCAIIVATVPTNANSNDSCAVYSYSPSCIRAAVHYISAVSMLLIFSYMSICIFTRTNDKYWKRNKWKVIRNWIYKICGGLTFLSMAIGGVLAICDSWLHMNVYTKSTYFVEVGALVPFGISWLVKGGFIFTDKGDPSTVAQVASVVTKGKLIKPVENNNGSTVIK